MMPYNRSGQARGAVAVPPPRDPGGGRRRGRPRPESGVGRQLHGLAPPTGSPPPDERRNRPGTARRYSPEANTSETSVKCYPAFIVRGPEAPDGGSALSGHFGLS